MGFIVRNARLSDFQKYSDLLQRTYEYAYTNEKIGLTKECFSKSVFSSQGSVSYLKGHLTDSPEQKTWLAFIGEKLIGSITCAIKNDTEAEISGFYVHPYYQGQGIGKSLYNLVLAFSDSRDLVLDLYAYNTKTIEIYKKWGWKLDTTRGNEGYFTRHWEEWPEGLEAPCMYMRLSRAQIGV